MTKFNTPIKKGIITLAIISFFYTANLLGQVNCNYEPPHEAENWVFGKSAMINFTSGQANAYETPIDLWFPNGTASISDASGNLLMLTDGIVVKQGGFYTIDNGDNLNGNNFSSQSSIIIPQPGNTHKYFVFTVDMYIPPVFTDGVNYSIVDVPTSGSSSVTSKNNSILNENAQKICATKHANGRDYWIVAHGFGDNNGGNFYSYLLNDSSLVTDAIITTIGHPQTGDETSNNGVGSMKISPDGSKLALVIPEDGVVEVYNFDNSTGKVSNLVSSSPGQFPYANGIEFSPDNIKLYFTISPISGTNYLYQVNLKDTDPFSSPFPVHQFEFQPIGSADSLLGAIQLGVDGRIYVAKFKKGINELNYLGIIYNPNRDTSSCNYNELNHDSNNGLYLNGGGSLVGLPNFASNFLNIPHFYYVNQCFKDTTSITIRNNANIDQADWDFGDPAGTLAVYDNLSPGFIYSDPGDYTISLTENYGNEQYLYTKDIRIHPLPDVALAQGVDTLYILENSSVQLDAGQWDFYKWSPGGSTERYLNVTEEGLFQVMVTDSNCCKNTDEVYIKYATINFPSAFYPKSNITSNSVFKIVGNYSGFKSYRFSIFNRWGQLLFESEDPTEGWDGTYNGKESPQGTYVYSAYFESFASDIKPSLVVKKSGTVTLLR